MTKNIVYLDETDQKINEDILSRKEFNLFKETPGSKNIIPRFLIKDAIEQGDYLELHSYQLFVKNYINPNTQFSRLLLKWVTGLGKTVGALSIALNFINYYQKNEEYLSGDLSLGSVFIVGFTQKIFRDELLKYPEFGFISREELDKLNKIKKQAYSGNSFDIENLKKFMTALKKRLHNRKGNGFFKFIGYKELTNHLFISKKEENINLHSLTDDDLLKMINSGEITINKELLNEFANSLLICDEIHNVYNSAEKNNWGIALQTILNYHKSCRAIFLSATPLNNSPTEVVDLLNLLLPRQHYKLLEKSDFFDKSENLLEGKESDLAKYLQGRISFIRNRNPKYMATKHFLGKPISGVDYLKFIRCPMSKFHYNTYANAIKDSEALGQEGVYLSDFALPDIVSNPYNKIGLYKAKEIREKLSSATQQWKSQNGVIYDAKKDIITGFALSKNLHIISGKYNKMIQTILHNIKNQQGKMFIYHNNIHISGTLFIQEILSQHGIIGEFDGSSDMTICAVCGEIRKKHSKEQLMTLGGSSELITLGGASTQASHLYYPARFIIVHSNIDKKQINQSLDKYNHINNIDGHKFIILIGSKIIKESHSINSVRHILIMSRPDNISTFIQIIGRAVRLNSHKLLPYKNRNVSISIFTSQVPNGLSYEETKYKEKINMYKVIQRIEKLMHENAIDAYFNYDSIWAPSDEDKNFDLTILPYKKPQAKINKGAEYFTLDQLNLSTFNAFYAKQEVEYIIYMIKRLFIEYSPVWKYEDLLLALVKPPFHVEINTKLISTDMYNIALNNLVYNESINYVEPALKKLNNKLSNLLDKVRNPYDKIFLEHDNVSFVLTHNGEYYILAPLVNDEIVYDVDILFRNVYNVQSYLIRIIDYLKFDMNNNYSEKKNKFIKKWETISVDHLELAICDFGIRFHQEFIEEVVKYVFDVWTDPKIIKSEYHNFYVKMLYYYDLQKLIAWAHTVNDTIKKKYLNYVLPVTTKLLNKKLLQEIQINQKEETSGFVNLLVSSINKNDPYWISTGMVKDYEDKLKITNALFDGLYKKAKVTKKINADLLPVGHFLMRVPRFYIPKEGWRDDPTYTGVDKSVKENSIIIGYDSRSKTGLSIKFKVRSPIQNIKQHKDTRLIEKGAICSTKQKSFLRDIAKKLNIEIDNSSINVDTLCQQIRSRLIYNELKGRMSNKPVRWFYFVYESA